MCWPDLDLMVLVGADFSPHDVLGLLHRVVDLPGIVGFDYRDERGPRCSTGETRDERYHRPAPWIGKAGVAHRPVVVAARPARQRHGAARGATRPDQRRPAKCRASDQGRVASQTQLSRAGERSGDLHRRPARRCSYPGTIRRLVESAYACSESTGMSRNAVHGPMKVPPADHQPVLSTSSSRSTKKSALCSVMHSGGLTFSTFE